MRLEVWGPTASCDPHDDDPCDPVVLLTFLLEYRHQYDTISCMAVPTLKTARTQNIMSINKQ